MSFNQSRAERSESSQYRRSSGRSGSSAQPRNFSGGGGKGGRTAPPSSSSVHPASSSLTSNRSFKKSNNAQGGQSRVSGGNVNSDSSNASSPRTVQNGSHWQPAVRAADAPVTGGTVRSTSDMANQKSAPAVPNAPSIQPATNSPDITAPATPTKASGDASRSFPLQFGSISPGFMNGMQIPARTNSAPPNLDEQKRDQAHHDSSRMVSAFPIPSVPKQQMQRKDGGAGDQSKIGDVHQVSKARRDAQISNALPIAQTQKASVHSFPGISMAMPVHQPQVPIPFGVPNPQIQSQGMTSTSLPIPMPLPLPMGNAQLQQQVFVSGLAPHPIHPQGIMHQGQSLNFKPQMGPQLPPQMGNVGISISQQFTQQQAGKLGGLRKPVKITHPDTHEELRLDRRADTSTDGGRSHPNVPQSQPITSVPSPHAVNYYRNSYHAKPLYFPGPSSVPLTNSPINPSSQAPPRFSFPISQGPPTVSFTNPSAKTLHGIAEPSSLEHSHDVSNATSSASAASVQVTVKPAAGSHVEKIAELSLAISSPPREKGESSKILEQAGETSSVCLQRDSETWMENDSHQPKPGPELMSSSLSVAGKQSGTASCFSVDGTVSDSCYSATPNPVVQSAPVVTHGTEGRGGETISRSDSIKDQQMKQIKKGHSQPQHQVSGQSIPISGLPSQFLEHANSFNSRTAGAIDTKITAALSSSSGGIMESTIESLSIHGAASPDASELKTDSAVQGSSCESSKTFGAALIDGLDSGNPARQNDFSRHDEPLKTETPGTKEQGVMLNEGPKQDGNRSETHSNYVSSKYLEEVNLVLKITTDSNKVGFLEEPVGLCGKDDLATDNLVTSTSFLCGKDDVAADNLVTSTSLVLDATNAENSYSSSSSSTRSNGDNKISASDTFVSRSDTLGSSEAVVTDSVQSDEREIPVSAAASVLEPTLKHEGAGSEDTHSGFISLPAAGSNDKAVIELTRSKSTVARGKKKRKEILQKADAAGTTSDLYMAYKGPEGKKEPAASSESMAGTSSINSKQVKVDDVVSSVEGAQLKAEPDDWEDAADISTPKLETVDDGKQVHGRMKHLDEDGNGVTDKKYSRDFLLKFSEQCTELPESFEISSVIAEVLMVFNVNASLETYPSPGRSIDRPSGGSRRGVGMGNDEKWSKLPGPLVTGRDLRLDGFGGNFRSGQGGNYGVLRNPRVQTPQFPGGILSGPMQSLGYHGGIQRNSPDSERWQHATALQKGLIPSPQTPLQVMHKAEKKYEIGKVTDEEQAKQRQLKAILNKLTPQNFEKLFEQVKAVNIDSAVTLTGVISQIFDKALTEPTFCEMYANFCFHLAGELPDFSEDNEKITFKRLLLNKCQEEFERGEREQEEADRADQEGDVKQSEEEREEKRIRVRRRMLGNIRLIGELYKKKMLTERIMHECIKKLLGQYQNSDEENIEALCKLMSTIGVMIDHPKAKEHMDAYFDMMTNLSNNMKLSSRVRFMLKDAIDLRKNKWQQRRKVEGPKKIEEVHRDAAQERQVQAGRLARGPGMNSSVRNRQSADFVPRGSNMLSPNAQTGSFRGLPTQPRNFGNQNFRLEERHSIDNRTTSVPLPQRSSGEDSITLGPQGGLARGLSIRGQPSITNIPLADAPSPVDSRRMPTGLNGHSSVSDRAVYGREDVMPRYIPGRFLSPREQSSFQEQNMNHWNREPRNADRNVDRTQSASPSICGRGPTPMLALDTVLPEERWRDMSIAAIREFYSAKDEKEVALCIKDLNAPSFYPMMISIWIADSFERKDLERALLAKLLINLTKSRDGILNKSHLVKGFEFALIALEDAVNDAPKAGEFLGHILARIISENAISFTEIGQLLYEGGEEKGRLVELGLAAEVVGTILETVKSEKGDSMVNEIRTSSSLKLEEFQPLDPKKSSSRLAKFI